MKRLSILSYLSIVCIALLLAGCQDDSIVQDTPPRSVSQVPAFAQPQEVTPSGIIEGEYIVIFENQFDNQISEQVAWQADQLRQVILSDHGISEDSVLNRYRYAIKGFAARLDSNQVDALKNDPRIARVNQNTKKGRVGIIPDKSIGSTTIRPAKEASSAGNLSASSQTVPWGISRVNGPFDGTGMKAWILDTGIDLDHPDLNVDTDNDTSFIAGESADDLNGHGTHVAGIIAAKDNTIDVVGVVAGATVVAVKVCDRFGDCPDNTFLAGVDYIAPRAQPEDIINISIWRSVNTDWDNAVTNAATTGLRFALIAGNAADHADNYSPGRTGQHSWIWTASAYDDNDRFATTFSNFDNPPIDFGGPGVDVPSLAIGGGVAVLSGTSMAAPHIAGIILNQGTNTTTDLGDNPVPVDGTVSSDPDGEPDQIAVASDLSVFISGPSFVTNGQQGEWTAEVSGGVSPYSYKWFRSNTDPPFWQQVGTGASYSETVTESFDLKVRVTDAENTTVTSDVFSVATN